MRVSCFNSRPKRSPSARVLSTPCQPPPSSGPSMTHRRRYSMPSRPSRWDSRASMPAPYRNPWVHSINTDTLQALGEGGSDQIFSEGAFHSPSTVQLYQDVDVELHAIFYYVIINCCSVADDVLPGRAGEDCSRRGLQSPGAATSGHAGRPGTWPSQAPPPRRARASQVDTDVASIFSVHLAIILAILWVYTLQDWSQAKSVNLSNIDTHMQTYTCRIYWKRHVNVSRGILRLCRGAVVTMTYFVFAQSHGSVCWAEPFARRRVPSQARRLQYDEGRASKVSCFSCYFFAIPNTHHREHLFHYRALIHVIKTTCVSPCQFYV